jgi:hypothetical protein
MTILSCHIVNYVLVVQVFAFVEYLWLFSHFHFSYWSGISFSHIHFVSEKDNLSRHQLVSYNPSYLRGRNQEDCGLKLTQANENTHHKKGLQSDSNGRPPP